MSGQEIDDELLSNDGESANWIELVNRSRNNEPGALDLFLAKLRPFIRGMAQNHLVRQGLHEAASVRFDASDITQTTLLSVTQHITDFFGSTEPEFVAWLKTILRHDVVDSIRQHIENQGRSVLREVRLDAASDDSPVPIVPIAEESSPSSVIAKLESHGRVAAAIQSLNALDREIVNLSFFQNRTLAEIANQLKLSTSSVSRKLDRAKKQLFKLLEEKQ